VRASKQAASERARERWRASRGAHPSHSIAHTARGSRQPAEHTGGEREREPSPSPVIALDGEQCEGAALSLVLVSRSAARRLRQAAPTRLQVPHTSLLPPTLTTRGENGLLRCQKYVARRSRGANVLTPTALSLPLSACMHSHTHTHSHNHFSAFRLLFSHTRFHTAFRPRLFTQATPRSACSLCVPGLPAPPVRPLLSSQGHHHDTWRESGFIG